MDFIKQLFRIIPSYIKIGFEDIKYIQNNRELLGDISVFTRINTCEYIILNTLTNEFQNNLITGTIPAVDEESIINRLIDLYEIKRIKIILYGKSSVDESVDKKAHQLVSLGFTEIYIYCGGIFEWLLLQEIYGNSEFPTTGSSCDILKYRPPKILGTLRLGY